MKLAGLRITKYGLALFAITLLGLALRLHNLAVQSIWLDEAVSVWMAKLSLSQIVQATAADMHPPLYYSFLHYWVMLFGTSESAVRLLSVLFGVLAIPVIFAVGRQLINEEAGLIGALLLALSSFNIQYSQETRMYSLMVLLALLSMYSFLRLVQRSDLVSSVGYVLSTALLLYTHVYGLLILVVQNLYLVTLLVMAKRRTFQVRRWIALEAIVIALFVPWAAVIISRTVYVEKSGYWIPPPTVNTLVQALTTYAGTATLLALFVMLSVLSLFRYNRVQGAMNWNAPFDALSRYVWKVRLHNVQAAYLLAMWVVVLNVIPFVVSRFSIPIYLDKYTIAASVALYLLVAAGISNITWKHAKVGIILVIGVLCVANLQPYYTTISKPQGREASDAVIQNAKSGDLVILYPPWHQQVFSYYNTRSDLAVPSLTSTSATGIINETRSKVDGHDRVWLIYAPYDSGVNKQVYSGILKGLNESYAPSFSRHYYGYDVCLYENRT